MHALTQPAPLRRLIARWPLWQPAALAIGSGAMASLAMEPWALWPLAPLGLGVLLLLLSARPGNGFALGLAFGFGHFLVSLAWIAEAFTYQAAMPPWMGWVAVAGLSLFLALYPALAAWGAARFLRHRSRGLDLFALTLGFAALWVVTEILRGLLFTGFPWNPLGAALLPLGGLPAMASIVGANGLSAIVILAGGALAALADARRERGGHALLGVLALLLLAEALLRLAVPAPRIAETAPAFLLIQPGTGIDDKHGAGGLERSIVAAVEATRAALEASPTTPAAVIWPEATVELPLEELPDLRAALVADLPQGTLLLTGGIAFERDAAGQVIAARNSLFALDGRGEVLARYDKAHLVPGGEYLPLRTIAEPLGLARIVPGTLDFWPGPGPVTWRLPGLPALAPNICYEIIFPAAIIARGERPAAIVTVSNDAWFGPTGPPQHHAQARLRAIEEGLPVLRVTPTGLTGLIGPGGELLETLPRGGVQSAMVRLPDARPPTAFSRFGLGLPLLFAVLLGVGAVLVANRQRKT
jgi:apolipoprotein N-acyltransferase